MSGFVKDSPINSHEDSNDEALNEDYDSNNNSHQD